MKSMPVTPPIDNRIAQLIDANLDRAREGLRVMEDWCRFGLNRRDFSIQIKDWRQQLGVHHHNIYRKERLKSIDPAMGVSHPLQKVRSTPEAVFIANSSRVQEALRVIEEFTRITDPKLCEIATKIRYETYEIEIKVLNATEGINKRETLKDWQREQEIKHLRFIEQGANRPGEETLKLMNLYGLKKIHQGYHVTRLIKNIF